ncbi:uncharacterized protein LOC132206616 isoform X2 [Stegostoma tigrinum]|uniref:uncharacterized protein LOC132206616 isoform X2 n=1 Tax=Stegostoma tigrinum TaxID=3053191 RepID=UPI0028708388|nr:uncharacterized protein LOC132206616 isoform X2 [Stegostoma tigrinum]
MAKPFDDGNSSDAHTQEHIPREVQTSLTNCTASTSGQYSPLPLVCAHSVRHQAEYSNCSVTSSGRRGQLTCGMTATTSSSFAGGSRQIQTIRAEEGVVSPLSLRGGNAQQDGGDDDAIIRQIGIQLRQMADQLHTYHMERVEEWDRRPWPVWYWTFVNFLMHTMAIFRMPRWR